MSVLIETSLGDIVIDLYVKECPKACLNFLKLCKIKYYNNCLFYDVQKDFIAQTGDPENTGLGGKSIYGILNGDRQRFFNDEISPNLRHNKKGIVSTANMGPNLNSSTFFIQITDKNLNYLNEKHSVFGVVEEGLDILDKINKVFVDKNNRPLQNIRIKHTVVIDDPFEDPKNLIIPLSSPDPIKDSEYNRLDDDINVDEIFKDKETEEKIKEKMIEHDAKNRALVLTLLEDLPDADIKPPENVLFVCKLNPNTQDDDLEIIFSRFGAIKSCKIIRDWKTGDSLQYAFIEFETVDACQQAYFKMNGVVIDERRIKVDFSQSVSKLWYNFKKNQMNEKNIQDKSNELMLPNENQKLEIKANKNFMNDNLQTSKNYKLLFDEEEKLDNLDKSNYQKSKKNVDYLIEQKTHSTRVKDSRDSRRRSLSRSDSDNKAYNRDRSKSRSHSRSRKRDYRDNKDNEYKKTSYYDKHRDKEKSHGKRSRSRDRYREDSHNYKKYSSKYHRK